MCVCEREGEEDRGTGEKVEVGAPAESAFQEAEKEVVSLKSTNNEMALTVIPFSLTRICRGNKANPAVS